MAAPIATPPNAPAVGAGGVIVRADAVAAPPPAVAVPDPRVKKVIVAVHGVGDQYSFATLQSVVNQFCGYYGQPAALPLGSFHNRQAAFSIHPPYPQDPFERLAFSEVYWARIPRAVVDDKHTMEESKKWAGTIVERLRMRWKMTGSKGDFRETDFDMMKLVLSEMVETLAVLERLCYLADRAGIFTFDLRKLLDDYLGDVQVVAEFGTEREKILEAFDGVMTGVHTAYPDAGIFVIAHSEGTVVSLLGMLDAGAASLVPEWLKRVRGFMTIGSPIDKHLILWPELFPGTPPAWTPDSDAERIEWRNYYDRGDPIGFSLDDARAWLDATGWNRVFSFTDRDDFGFDRYPFPGKAHVDYWTDPTVFGHFIETVIREPSTLRTTAPTAGVTRPPGDIRWKKWLSYVVPYTGVAALLSLGVFILYKAVIGAIYPKNAELQGTAVILRSVACTTTLLLGVTVATRVLRLARDGFWQAFAFSLWALCVALYIAILSSGETLTVLRDSRPMGVPTDLLLIFGLGIAVSVVTKLRPGWGLKPLILLGTTLIAFVVAQNIYFARNAGDIGPVWPVLLATAAFLYLWWLAALTFDLVFVWHLHIRQARGLARMDEIIGTPWGGARAERGPAQRTA